MKQWKCLWLVILTALLLSGCAMPTIDQLYSLPKRSQAYSNLQSAIDEAMEGLEYAAPDSGENQQTVQQADLDGDGIDEYLLFARRLENKAPNILIFRQEGDRYFLDSEIENPGFSFEQVEYVNIDHNPGVEIVIGCRFSDQVLRTMSVYAFSHEGPVHLLSTNYSKFLTCDLDQNGMSEIILLMPGETESDSGICVSYQFRNNTLERSREANLSGPVDAVKRIMVSPLQSGETAVYVASSVNENAIITDIFAIKYGKFTNISLSSESETSVKTMRNYYVYADDIDSDGVLELPNLISMENLPQQSVLDRQYLIRWYAMDVNCGETDKRYTYHNFKDGWYLDLTEELAPRISVRQTGNESVFFLWNSDFTDAAVLFRVISLSGPNREDEAMLDDRFVLHRGDGVVYAGKLENTALAEALNQETVTGRFHLIHRDWKTGET